MINKESVKGFRASWSFESFSSFIFSNQFLFVVRRKNAVFSQSNRIVMITISSSLDFSDDEEFSLRQNSKKIEINPSNRIKRTVDQQDDETSSLRTIFIRIKRRRFVSPISVFRQSSKSNDLKQKRVARLTCRVQWQSEGERLLFHEKLPLRSRFFLHLFSIKIERWTKTNERKIVVFLTLRSDFSPFLCSIDRNWLEPIDEINHCKEQQTIETMTNDQHRLNSFLTKCSFRRWPKKVLFLV